MSGAICGTSPGCRFRLRSASYGGQAAHPGYDSETCFYIPAARNARVMHRRCPLEVRGRREHRMLAAPAGLACKEMCILRTQETTGQPEQPAFPAQWADGLYVISSVCRAFEPPSPCVRHARLDPSIGGSGPHDFAVRDDAFVHAASALSILTSIASRSQRP